MPPRGCHHSLNLTWETGDVRAALQSTSRQFGEICRAKEWPISASKSISSAAPELFKKWEHASAKSTTGTTLDKKPRYTSEQWQAVAANATSHRCHACGQQQANGQCMSNRLNPSYARKSHAPDERTRPNALRRIQGLGMMAGPCKGMVAEGCRCLSWPVAKDAGRPSHLVNVVLQT